MAATEKKITKRDRFEEIKALLADNADIVEFCDNEIALLDGKAEKAKARNAKKKAEGDALQDKVEALLTGEFQTIDAIMNGITDEDATKAKVQARLTKLVNAGVAVKDQVSITVDGKKTKRMAYSIADVGDAE